MRKLLIPFVVILLAGCSKQTDFLMSEDDTLKNYTNNPLFTKIEVDFPEKITAYQFFSTPTSVFSINTHDLKTSGGFVGFRDTGALDSINLYIKGKGGFNSLSKRIEVALGKKIKSKGPFGLKKNTAYAFYTDTGFIGLTYSPITDWTVLTLKIN